MIEFAGIAGAAKVLVEGRKLLRELAQSKLSDQHQALVNQILEIVTDAQERLSVLQGTIIDLQEENRALRDQLKGADDWSKRLAKYERFQTPVGHIVLREMGSEPPVYACPTCVESEKEIHHLQFDGGTWGSYTCAKCGRSYNVAKRKAEPQRPPPNPYAL